MTELIKYIEKLVNTPSPTGFTKEIGAYLIKNAKNKNIDAVQTRKGAVVYRFPGENEKETIMFAAHIDTLGAMVKQVKEDKVLMAPIGGYPPFYVIGDYCTIHTFDGKKISGTILPDNPAVHVNETLKKNYKPDFSTLFIRVDERVDSKEKQTHLSNQIEVGNYISFDASFQYKNGFVKSRHLDDKASCAVFLGLSDAIANGSLRLKKNVHFFFNITEETGQGMAGVSDGVDDLIIVDMGVVGDGCNGDEYHVSICPKDSSGPYHYDLTQELIQTAKDNEIGYKVDVFPFYASDGSSVLRSGKDMRVALLGPGVSASHGHERTHTSALEQTQNLITAYIRV